MVKEEVTANILKEFGDSPEGRPASTTPKGVKLEIVSQASTQQWALIGAAVPSCVPRSSSDTYATHEDFLKEMGVYQPMYDSAWHDGTTDEWRT